MRTLIWASLGLSAACAGSAWGSTVTAANLGGPTDGGGAVGYLSVGPLPIAWGQVFTATVGGTLETISVDLVDAWSGGPNLYVSVFEVGGSDAVPTGAALGSAFLAGGTPVVGLNTFGFSGQGVSLTGGTQYAFVAHIAPGTDTPSMIPYTVALDQTSVYAGGNAVFASDGTTFQTSSITNLIFEVTVQAVPAPLAAVSGMLGLGVVGGVRRR